jgi:hypothetical protein
VKSRIHFLPIIFALLVSATIAFSQTTYLGNILQLHRQDAGSLPAASNYQGSIVYDTGGNTVWYSNGTSWQPIDTTGGGGGDGGADGFWLDAGAGSNAFFGSPSTFQVRVGSQTVPPYGTVFGASSDPRVRSAMSIYTDAGTTLYLTQRQAPGLFASSTDLDPNSVSSLPHAIVINGGLDGTNNNFQSILFANQTTNSAYITRTFFTPSTTGGFRNGLNYVAPAGEGHSFMVNGVTSGSQPFVQFANNLINLGVGTPVVGALVHVQAVGFTDGILVTNGPTNGMRFAANGTDLDLGSGTNDFLSSNGTRVQQGDLTSGGIDAHTYRVVGNTTGANMVTSVTTGNGGLGFRQTDNQLYTMSTGKEARPILSGPDWAYDGRFWNVDTSWENTNCPVIQETVISASGGNVAVSCTDVAAGGAAVSPSGFPVRGYRTFNTDTIAGSRSGFSSGTMPASGAGGTPTAFVQRRGGPVLAMWVRTGATVSNARWYAGMLTAIPAVGLPSSGAQGAYLRFDTSASDTQFRLCTQDGTTVNCANSGTTPATNTEYLFVIDARESSSGVRLYVNGANAVQNVANLPSLTVNMGFVFAIENTSTTAQSWGMGRVSLRTE